MALGYATERGKAYRILDLTSLTEEEFELIVTSFDQAFLAHMQDWTLEGKPRTGRRYSQYTNCPLPSPEDRLLFILSYLKQAPTQAFHGAAFGMGQSKANQWIHVLLPALHTALARLGDLPSRNLIDLKQRLSHLSQETQAAPFFMMAPSVPSPAHKTRMNKPAIIAARKNGIVSKMCS
jgi:Helix-turn-helix of DDE superfamily endonuclease